MNTSLVFKIMIFSLLLVAGEDSWSHAHLLATGDLVPRNSDPGLKMGPCGGVPRTATPKVLQPGATITVNWEETIQHKGRFEFYFSPANDANFVLLQTVPDVQDNTATLPHQYSTKLTVPNTPCTACTIQLIQVMLDNPANPSYYYSCADIQIAGPPPTSTPAPTPVECKP